MNIRRAASRLDQPYERLVAQSRVRSRFRIALAFSLLVHALVLSLDLGEPGTGAPGLAWPWAGRRVQAPDLTVRLADVPPRPAAAPPSSRADVESTPLEPVKPARAENGFELRAPVVARATPPAKRSRPRSQSSEPGPAAEAPAARPEIKPAPQPEILAQEPPRKDTFSVPAPRPVEPEPPRAPEIAAAEQDELEARQKAEEERRKAQDALRLEEASRQEAAKAQAEEEARIQAESENRKRTEEDARQRALALQKELEARKQEEVKKQEEARRLALEENRRMAEDEARRKAEAAEAEKRKEAQAEAIKRAEEAARQQAAVRQKEREAQRLAENEARRTAEAERQKEQDARRLEEEAAARAERLAAKPRPPGPASGGPAGGAPAPGAPSGKDIAAKALGQLRAPAAVPADKPSPPSPPLRAENQRRRSVFGVERDIVLRWYVESWRMKIERNGPLNYRPLAAQRAPDYPVVTVVIRSDGSLEDVHIHRSSGLRELDEAVRRISRLLAPYSAFPAEMARQFDVIEIRRVWQFEDTLRILEEVR